MTTPSGCRADRESTGPELCGSGPFYPGHAREEEGLDFRARVLDTLGELEVREGKIVPKEE